MPRSGALSFSILCGPHSGQQDCIPLISDLLVGLSKLSSIRQKNLARLIGKSMAEYRGVDLDDHHLRKVFRVSPYQLLEFSLILLSAGFPHEPTEGGDLAKPVGISDGVQPLGEVLQLRPVAMLQSRAKTSYIGPPVWQKCGQKIEYVFWHMRRQVHTK
jgi:hypothetical protein